MSFWREVRYIHISDLGHSHELLSSKFTTGTLQTETIRPYKAGNHILVFESVSWFLWGGCADNACLLYWWAYDQSKYAKSALLCLNNALLPRVESWQTKSTTLTGSAARLRHVRQVEFGPFANLSNSAVFFCPATMQDTIHKLVKSSTRSEPPPHHLLTKKPQARLCCAPEPVQGQMDEDRAIVAICSSTWEARREIKERLAWATERLGQGAPHG